MCLTGSTPKKFGDKESMDQVAYLVLRLKICGTDALLWLPEQASVDGKSKFGTDGRRGRTAFPPVAGNKGDGWDIRQTALMGLNQSDHFLHGAPTHQGMVLHDPGSVERGGSQIEGREGDIAPDLAARR